MLQSLPIDVLSIITSHLYKDEIESLSTAIPSMHNNLDVLICKKIYKPAIYEQACRKGVRRYYRNNVLHRLDGPAVVYTYTFFTKPYRIGKNKILEPDPDMFRDTWWIDGVKQ